MSKSTILDPRIEILKALGHKSRTLLNGVTGPVEIIRSLSDEPRLIEPLRMLELSVSRFEKYSFRALLLSDLLRSNKMNSQKTLNLVDVVRYLILDLTDLLDFYNVKIEPQNNTSSIELQSDIDLLTHCILIILEQTISLVNGGSTIVVEFNSSNNQIECSFKCTDNGLVYKSLFPIFTTSDYPTDIDLYLLKLGSEILNSKLDFSLSQGNQSVVKLTLL